MRRLVGTALLACCTALIAPRTAAGPIQINDLPVELTLAQVGERTVHVVIVPLDEQGRAKPDPPSAVLVPFESVERLRLRELEDARDLTVGRLRLRIQPRPLTVTLRRADGSLVQELAIDQNDGSIRFRTEAPVFGLGEGRQQFDRRGFYFDFVNGQTTFLATHSATIPVPFLIGADGWSIFIHNPPPPSDDPREANRPWGQFDLRGDNAGPPPPSTAPAAALLAPPAVLPRSGRFIPRPQTLGRAPIHVFVSALDRPVEALEEFTRLTGHPVMPPKWVLGYMQSHRSLAGPQEPIEVARAFREKRLPCDALIYLGTGYTNGPSGWNLGHGSLEFNPKVFDRPQEMLDALHAMNFKVVLHKNAAPARLHGDSLDEKSDDPFHISNYWPPHVPLVKMGVDGWWPDDGDQLPIEARLARHRLYYDGSLKARPGERPWALHRNGYAGIARYGGWIWSGDVQSRWVTLANHVPVGLNVSLSLTPFWGSDIGGFFLAPRNEYTGELYVRWFQFAAFTPLMRSHGRNWHLHLPSGWNTGEIGPRESGERVDYPPEAELHNAAVEPICRKYLELRYQLLPYNYTLMREACDTGMPPMRALWLEYPDDAQVVKLADEYLWGPSILVAPVVEKTATKRRLYLPKGIWHDWWTGEKLEGGRWIERPVDLATLPLYVRAGGIVPLDPVRQYTAQPVTEPTTIRVYAGANGQFTLYDDDGHSTGYGDGSDASMIWLLFRWQDADRRLIIEPDSRMKRWPGGVRRLRVHLDGSQKQADVVEFNGQRIEVRM